jgi:hypothetical protein
MTLDLTEPGVLCRLGASPDLIAKCKDAGLVWVAPQTWNRGSQPFSLDAIHAAGLAAPVWGVTYNAADFAADGDGLAFSALGAKDGLIIDAEVVLDNADPTALWQHLDHYTGPKALSCEGNGTDPDKWPLPVNVKGAVDRGYVAQPQAYYNAADFLTPANAIFEWTGHGFAADRIAPCIGLHVSESNMPKPNNRLPFSAYVPLLEAAGCGRRFSIFADSDITDQDFADIKSYLSKHPPAPVAPTAAATRTTMENAAKAWDAGHATPQPTSRIDLARRIVAAGNTDARWLSGDRQLGSKLKSLLDSYGIPG